MATYVKQGDIFGRIGSGVGQGLAEQVPKEIERSRLASGLQNFEREYQGLSPIQQLARLSAIPGITPQTIQSFQELARHQNQRNAYGNRPGQQEGRPKASADLSEVQAQNVLQQADQSSKPSQGISQFDRSLKGNKLTSSRTVENDQRSPNVRPEESVPEIVNENPLNPAALTRLPWSPQQRDSRIIDYMNQGFLADQARELASDDEARDLAQPGALQKRLKELTGKSDEARSEFRRQLETKLQKTGEGLFKDITGEMLVNMERGMERDLRTHPNASFKDVANDWSDRALNVAKAKGQLNKLSSVTGWESLLTGDKILKKLQSYEDIFKKSGNSEEYFNILKKNPGETSVENPDKGGFGLSPQGAATIAFPLTKQIKQYVNSFSPEHTTTNRYGDLPDTEKIRANSRKAAVDIEKHIDSDDSILSIARALSQKDPYFDQQEFFDQLEEDKHILRLNDRQKRELAEGVRDVLPTWGDIKILPWFRRSSK